MVSKLNKKLIIIGTGKHAEVALNLAILNKYDVKGFLFHSFDNKIDKKKIGKYPLLGTTAQISKIHKKNYIYFIAIGDNKIRKSCFEIFQKKYQLINLIHPNSSIAYNLKIGINNLISDGVIINTNVKVKNNCIINTGSIIDHHVKINSHCHICPGVKIAGSVKIHDNCFLGIGSIIIDNILINKNATVGAGSVVIRNIVSSTTVVGNPGKKIN